MTQPRSARAGAHLDRPHPCRRASTTACRSAPANPQTPSPRAVPRPRCASPRPTWCPPTPTCATTMRAGPNSKPPAPLRWNGSTPARTRWPGDRQSSCWSAPVQRVNQMHDIM